MLGTGSINLKLAEQKFGNPQRAREQHTQNGQSRSAVPSGHFSPKISSAAAALRTYQCPIPGCGKIYQGSRGGWDAHVGSLRIHPSWHPEYGEALARRSAILVVAGRPAGKRLHRLPGQERDPGRPPARGIARPPVLVRSGHVLCDCTIFSAARQLAAKSRITAG
jgi:hypothetical protein